MTSTANFTGRSSSKTPRAASRSPRKAPRWQTSIRSASWRPYAATALRCATTAGKSSWERQLGTTPGDGGAGCIPREELARYIRTEPPGGETPSAQLLTFDAVSARHIDTRVRFDDVRFADAGKTWCDTDPETGRAVATEREIVDTRGRTFTVRTAATCVYAKEPLPQGTGSLYGIIDYFAGKYTLRITNREAEFSGTAAHSAATRPTAGRPARTTRTTRAGVTAATPPTAYP